MSTYLIKFNINCETKTSDSGTHAHIMRLNTNLTNFCYMHSTHQVQESAENNEAPWWTEGMIKKTENCIISKPEVEATSNVGR